MTNTKKLSVKQRTNYIWGWGVLQLGTLDGGSTVYLNSPT